ncbi:MAG TPA: hypothetical protein VF062_27380 [Candidatus Limnocylindrales bacterium]
MRSFRASLAATLAATVLSVLWVQPAQGSQLVVVPVSQWAYTTSDNANGPTTDSFIAPGDPTPAATVLRVGNDTTGRLYRGFMRFSLTGISGQILNVQLVGRVDHTWSCSPRPTSFYRTAAIAVTPRQPWPGPSLLTPLGSNNVNASESVCNQPNLAFTLSTAVLRNDVQTAVLSGQPAYFVGISARDLASGANEAAADRWMRYFLNDFRLQITFAP